MRYLILLLISITTTHLFAQDTVQAITYNIRNCHARDGENAWPKRKQKVFDLINKYNPDVLGMQEVLYLQLKNLSGALKEYSYVGAGRNDGKKAGEYSPIFYKKDKYQLLDGGTFWLSETPAAPGSKSWDAALTRICTWAMLKSNSTSDTFFVFNTHFDHKGAKAREESTKIIMQKVAELAHGLPFYICGDFNFTDQSVAYKTLLTITPKVDDSFKYARHLNNETNTDYGFKVANTKGSKIDYIFTGTRFTAISCMPITDNDGANYPSDHLPFMATLVLKH